MVIENKPDNSILYLTLIIFIFGLITDQKEINFENSHQITMTLAFFFGKLMGIYVALCLLEFILRMLLIGFKKAKSAIFG